MPKKGTKGVKKEKKIEEEKKEDLDEDRFKVDIPEHNWIKLRLKLVNAPSEYNYFDEFMKTNERIMEIRQKIVNYHGRIDNIQIFDKDPNQVMASSSVILDDGLDRPRYNEFNDAKTTLYSIFNTLGEPSKKQAKEHLLYYDFHPFNSTEPILLALMVKDPLTNKTI